MIAVRELNLDGVPDGQRNWLNDHTVYTHGYGIVAAYGNRKDADGKPVFFEQNIPSTGTLGKFEPRIYFGEQSPDYSIVGARRRLARELDFDQPAGGAGNTTYAARAASRSGTFRQGRLRPEVPRAELPASDAVNDDSRMLYNRTRGAGPAGRSVPDLDGDPTLRSSTAACSGSSTGTRRRPTTRTPPVDLREQATSDTITTTRTVLPVAAEQSTTSATR